MKQFIATWLYLYLNDVCVHTYVDYADTEDEFKEKATKHYSQFGKRDTKTHFVLSFDKAVALTVRHEVKK